MKSFRHHQPGKQFQYIYIISISIYFFYGENRFYKKFIDVGRVGQLGVVVFG